MTDQANTHAGAEPPDASGDRRADPDALVPAAADHASPPVIRAGPVLLGAATEASEPYVLPPPGIIAYVLGNKHVWRRFMVSTVVLAIATLVVAFALRVAGIQFGVSTVSITSAATALGIVARAYFGQRRATKQAPPTDTASDDASSS